ncbi:DUF11 domain-containing protein [Candidatus Saccharibacteria bacterium]|nr:DUF11 domain-containing protein [Candidatus Saccharibacteria bacterium]
MSIFSKLKNIAKSVPKKVAAVFGIVTAIAVPAVIWAASPSFTWQEPAPFVYFNAITDNPNWGDEHDFVRISEGSGALTNNITIQDGHTYNITMLVHNDASHNLNLKATGVVGGIFYNTNESNSINITGVVKADNCGETPVGNIGNLCQFTDTATFTGGKNFVLDYVEGSARYQNNAGTFTLPDKVINSGANLGYNQMDGVIPGCWPYHGLLTVKVVARIREQPKTPSYDVEKKVNGVTHNAVRPGDTMTYTIVARNTGNVDLTNVKINDTLPAYYQSATEVLPNGATGSIINNPHVVTIPKLAVGASATITITYKVKNQSAFECDETTNFINKVTSSTNEKNGEDRTDNNQVDTDVTYPCDQKNPSYDLIKTVNKATAKPGETLIYTLKYINTGEVDLTNVVIKDTLPTGINWVDVDVNANNGSGITDTDKLFTTGVKIATVRVGGSVTIKITAKVASDAVPTEECGDNSKTFVNRAESSAAEKPDQPNNADEDNPNNNSASTTVTVNKECKENPSYDVIKTVDKATAKPGETLIYTLTVKNTGDIDLTNVVVKDTLPNYIASAKATTTAPSAVSGDLFKEGITIAKLGVGQTATIKIEAVIKSAGDVPCGTTQLVNRVTGTSDQDKTEDRTDNNTATTTIDKDCVPPPPPPPYVPDEVPATGPAESAAAVIGSGAMTFGAVAYVRSRKNLTNKLRGK